MASLTGNGVLPFATKLTIDAIVEALKCYPTFDDFCVYVRDNTFGFISGQDCYLSDYPDVDTNDREVFPAFVTKEKLQLAYRGDQFNDVVLHVLRQKPGATIEDFITALNYYHENDDFLDFD